ncbi:energy transducer TonB [Sphingomonas sp.]|uniref:energy transducer TonB n=1 Tax=Sphingomonas sp. TaxID=28214 RepID=UPI002DD6AFBA|nr:energy transducer TonB [Sphingomonas sp.]
MTGLLVFFSAFIAAQTPPTPHRLTGADNYPPDARQRGEQGRVDMVLKVDPSGKVTKCETTASSGSKVLDRASCRFVTAKVRYTPATDAAGVRINGSAAFAIRWAIGCNSNRPVDESEIIYVCTDRATGKSQPRGRIE